MICKNNVICKHNVRVLKYKLKMQMKNKNRNKEKMQIKRLMD